MSRIRIVATIGPATCSLEALSDLARAGVDVARLNGSHADFKWLADTIKSIRHAIPDAPIFLDLPGRKIRTLSLSHEPSFLAGDSITLTTDPTFDGQTKVPVGSTHLHKNLKSGDVILADDGSLQFTVNSVDGRDIHCTADTAGTLRSRKGINVPWVDLGPELITDRDRELIDFAKKMKLEYVGVSFAESAAHVQEVRALVGTGWPRIVAKIENASGMRNMDEILVTADAVMIDRGDLAVECGIDEVIIFQKRIVERARKYACPVIIATEMLESMTSNSFPTKAEVSDITNAVLDGCSAIMLSAETAIGSHPAAAVEIMSQVSVAAEAHAQQVLDDGVGAKTDVQNAMQDAVAFLCRSLPIAKIIAVTRSGYAARAISSRRPSQPILAVSDDPMAARSFNLFWGTKGFYCDVKFSRDKTDHVIDCVRRLWVDGKIDDQDLILTVALSYPRSGNRMNSIQTHLVSDLVDALGWKK